jgi:radical SAM protein with 4Fe4S-binding SPASM domain
MKYSSFKKIINNDVSKYLIKKFSNKKTKSGKNLLEQYFYCYFSDTVIDEMKSFLNYKTRIFNFFFKGLEKMMVRNLPKERTAEKIHFFAIRASRALSAGIRAVPNYGLIEPLVYDNPLHVTWNITNRCNLNCIHCSQNSGRKTSDELNLKEKLDVVDQLADANCAVILFCGGEPLMSKDFFPLVKYACERGLVIEVVSNGTLITKGIAKKIAKIGIDYIAVSLDGATKETHEKIRGKDTYEKTIQGIKNCIGENIMTLVSTTLTKNNYKEIDDIIDLSKSLGAKRMSLVDFVPVGRGMKIIDLDPPPKIKYEVLRKFAKRKLEEVGIELFSTMPQFGRIVKEMSSEIGNNSVFGFIDIGAEVGSRQFSDIHTCGCESGRLSLGIDPNGDIRPCFLMNVVVGNTRKDKVIEVWKNSEILKSLRTREDLKGNCGTCENKYICGGCRTRALVYFNDLKAPDPGCIKNVELWNQIKK